MITCVVVAIGILSSCIPGDPSAEANEAIGLRQDPQGNVVIEYALCPDERVVRVELWHPKGNVVGDGNDTLLWRLRAGSRGSRDSSFVVGGQSHNFLMEKKLTATLDVTETYAVGVTTNQQTIAIAMFRLDELHRDDLLVSDGVSSSYVEEETFSCTMAHPMT
jgi:hypothetical protein